MKKIFFTCLALLTIYFSSNAQTTQEEYNYVTKGWKKHLDEGSDVKHGYEMIMIDEINSATKDGSKRSVSMYSFVKKSPVRKIAAYMVTYKKDNDPVEYICVPHPESAPEINKQYYTTLYNGDPMINTGYRLSNITYLLSRNLKF